MTEKSKNSPNIVQMVMVGLLIVGAFFIGMLWTKVQSMESSGGPKFADNAKVVPSAANKADAPTAPATAKDLDPITKDDWVKGNANARYALVEYSDIDCPYCQRFHPTAEQMVSEYEDQVMWVYRHFPLDSLHPDARRKAEATECAGKIGGNDKFWAFLDEANAQGSTVGADKMADIAVKVGLNASAFNSCYDKGETKDLVDADYASGIKAGIQGTPGNILLDIQTGETLVLAGAVPFDMLKTSLDTFMKE